MEDWAEIRRLYRSEKLSQAAIARRLGLSRNTVAKALRSEVPPRYERRPAVESAWAQIEMFFPVLVMVAAYSPFIAAVMIPSRVTGDLLAGMWELIAENIGGVPRTFLWDNESGIGQRGRLAEGVAGFCGVLGTRLIQARPYDPETKGLVERVNGYLETSFLPGRAFVSAADFNAQLLDWLISIANRRTHAITTRLGRDYYVSAGGNAYSVHPEAIGRMITVRTGLDRIMAHCGDRTVADHQRLRGTAGLVTEPEHVAAAAILPEQFRTRPARGAHLEVDVEVADLSAYDTIFGTGEVARASATCRSLDVRACARITFHLLLRLVSAHFNFLTVASSEAAHNRMDTAVRSNPNTRERQSA